MNTLKNIFMSLMLAVGALHSPVAHSTTDHTISAFLDTVAAVDEDWEGEEKIVMMSEDHNVQVITRKSHHYFLKDSDHAWIHTSYYCTDNEDECSSSETTLKIEDHKLYVCNYDCVEATILSTTHNSLSYKYTDEYSIVEQEHTVHLGLDFETFTRNELVTQEGQFVSNTSFRGHQLKESEPGEPEEPIEEGSAPRNL
jgi:hypothetical protein